MEEACNGEGKMISCLLLPILLLACAPLAQADIFNLDDAQLEVVPAEPEKPSVATPSPAPKPPVPVPASPANNLPPTPSAPAQPPVSLPVAQPPAPAPAIPLPPEFAHYRTARAAFQKKDYATAFVAFNRVMAMDKAVRAKDKSQPESPLAAVARLGREQCRLAAGDAQAKAKALACLRKFVEDGTLLRGEAMLVLAHEEMRANHPEAAWPWFVKWEAWLKNARQSKPDASDLPEAMRPMGGPWQPQPDVFGYAVRMEGKPEWLMTEWTCAWFLDDLESRGLEEMGCVALLRGDEAKMKACWARLEALEPPIPEGMKKAPTNATRLGIAAKKASLPMAYPGEERLFDGLPTARKRIAYAEYLYLSERFPEAIAELKEVLAADDVARVDTEKRKKEFVEAMKKAKVGVIIPKFHATGFTDAQRDYVLSVLGSAHYRDASDPDGQGKALRCFEEVFKETHNTPTERKCVLARLNVARSWGTPADVAKALELREALLASPMRDHYACLNRWHKATEEERHGRKDEAMKLWSWYKPEDGDWYEMAQKALAELKPPSHR